MDDHRATIEAEQALLGAALTNAAVVIRRASELGLRAEDFVEPFHRAVWAELVERDRAGHGADIRLIVATIGDHDLGGATVHEYLTRLAFAATTVTSVGGYVHAIIEAARLRRLREIGETLVRFASGPVVETPTAIAREALTELDEVARPRGTGASFVSASIGDAADAALTELDATRAGRRSSAVPTGLRQLDALFGGGWRPGQLVIIAGRPGMGKSAAAITFALHAAQAGHGTVITSLEMAAQEIAERALSALCFGDGSRPIPYASLRRPNRLLPDDIDRLKAARERLRKAALHIEAGSAMTVARVRERATAAARRFDSQGTALRLVVIDHLGLLRSTRNLNNRVAEVSEITAALKGLARELAVPVVALSQLSRQSEHRDDKRPQLSDLRDSGSIEQDADVVLGLYRPTYHLDRLPRRTPEQDAELLANQNLIELEILKNRAGPTARIRAFCSIASNVIADRDSA